MMANMKVEPAPWSLSQGCPGRGTAEGRHTFVIMMMIDHGHSIMIIMRVLEEIMKYWR